jgi:hypothetical protein
VARIDSAGPENTIKSYTVDYIHMLFPSIFFFVSDLGRAVPWEVRGSTKDLNFTAYCSKVPRLGW